MGLQILKVSLVLCAVFLPLIIAKLVFMRNMNQWFSISENSVFGFGFPVTKEGYVLSGVLILIVIFLLVLINIYI